MATVIREKTGLAHGDWLCEDVRPLLPPRLTEELCGRPSWQGRVEELRLRAERHSYVTTERGNFLLRTVLGRAELEELVTRLCGGSLYAYRESIAAGYLTLHGGIRVGLCGRASVDGERIVGVYDICGLNLRFPHNTPRIGEPVCRLLSELDAGQGVLIYGPPGEGKTTLLRSVSRRMASGERPLRVVVIDTRGELGASLDDPRLSLDLLTGYPRALGLEIATRTMNAQLIVCDEIGERREVDAMLSVQNCGVPFVASAHARTLAGLLRRDGIERLHRAHVFGAYVGIERPMGGGEFHYTVTDWESADELLRNRGLGASCM